MDSIRKYLGMCPQHNVLFNEWVNSADASLFLTGHWFNHILPLLYFFLKRDERIKQVITVRFNHMHNESSVSAYVSHQHIIIPFPFSVKKRIKWTLLTPSTKSLRIASFSLLPLLFLFFSPLDSNLFLSLHKLITCNSTQVLHHNYAWATENDIH